MKNTGKNRDNLTWVVISVGWLFKAYIRDLSKVFSGNSPMVRECVCAKVWGGENVETK